MHPTRGIILNPAAIEADLISVPLGKGAKGVASRAERKRNFFPMVRQIMLIGA